MPPPQSLIYPPDIEGRFRRGPGQHVFTPGGGVVPAYSSGSMSQLSPGPMSAAAFLAATGLTFTRVDTVGELNAASVQTSASSVASGISPDQARIFSDGVRAGLLLEQNVGGIGGSPRRKLGWEAGSGIITDLAGPGADGQPNQAVQQNLLANQFGFYLNSVVPGRVWTVSSWQRSVNAAADGDMQMVWTNDGATGEVLVVPASDTYSFQYLNKDGQALQFWTAADGRNYSGAGGQTARARNVYTDFSWAEWGNFPTSVTGTTVSSCIRPRDRVSRTVWPTANGRVRIYLSFWPRFSTGQQVYYFNAGATQTHCYLYSSDLGTNYARVRRSDERLLVKTPSGAEVLSANPISLTRDVFTQVLLEVGAGAPSVASYRVGAGAWQDLALGNVNGDATPATAMTLLRNDGAPNDNFSDGGTLPSILDEVQAYDQEVSV